MIMKIFCWGIEGIRFTEDTMTEIWNNCSTVFKKRTKTVCLPQ